MKYYYLMVNHYRTSTSHGFDNTWGAMAFTSRAERDAALRGGLAVNDQCDANGRPSLSTMGLRLPTAAERRKIKTYGDEE